MTISPLLIPELLSLIAEFFTSEEAAAPSRVCRTWKTVFRRIVWDTSVLSCNNCDSYLDGLIQNADLVRVLEYHEIGSYDWYAVPCARLARLVLLVLPKPDETEGWDLLCNLLVANNQLQEIHVTSYSTISINDKFWSALTSRPNLRILEIHHLHLEKDQFGALWEACKMVRKLTLHGVRVFVSQALCWTVCSLFMNCRNSF